MANGVCAYGLLGWQTEGPGLQVALNFVNMFSRGRVARQWSSFANGLCMAVEEGLSLIRSEKQLACETIYLQSIFGKTN